MLADHAGPACATRACDGRPTPRHHAFVPIDADHPFFAHPAALEGELARVDAHVPAAERPRGSFDALSQAASADGPERLQGRVWARSGVAGVWATRDREGHLTEVVFWTVVDGAVRVEEFAAPAWGRRSPNRLLESALVAEAAAWRDRQAGHATGRVGA